MKPVWILPVLFLPAVAMAADETKKPSHPSALGVCSKEAHAKGLKGDERKKFISSCITGAKAAKTTAPAPHSAQ